MTGIFAVFDPLLFASLSLALVTFGLIFYLTQDRSERRSRSDIRKRLDISQPVRSHAEEGQATGRKASARKAARRIVQRTNDFYANSDPKAIRKMQMQLIQAGYLHPQALGHFITARIVVGIIFAGLGVFLAFAALDDWSPTNRIIAVLLLAMVGYFLPNFHVKGRIKKLRSENRAGFPDVMDLMIVSSEAGLTMEASIERIAREIERTYPTLSRQLSIAALEIRAGRPLDQALRAFGERLGLDEVQGFATMVQQSKELGTSVAGALRVYSEEMRHKRMMAAEEKAYALPAKLSIPVTAFILPIVIGVAVLPTVVRLINS